MQATCDYCGAPLGCEIGSMQDLHYWRLDHGVRSCDPCLATNFNDYIGMEHRIVALRLRWAGGLGVNLATADVVIEQAKRVIIPEQVELAIQARDRVLECHGAGEYLAMMEAGRALFFAANDLNNSIVEGKAIRTGRKIIKGGKKGGSVPRAKGKADSIIAEGDARQSIDAAGVAAIARKVGASRQYVRRVLKEKGN
jgi:hypothetical protein